MQRIKRILLLLAATALTTVSNAQTINGDLNHNNRLDMADMTKLLNNYLTGTVETYTTPTVTIGDNGNWFIDGVDTGKPSCGRDGYDGLTPTIGSNGDWFIGSIDTGVSAVNKTDPFDAANSLVVGTWYKSPTESITFKSNGTTDYATGYTYKFLPFQGRILFFNASGVPVASLHVTYITKDYLAILPAGSDVPVLYTVTKPVEITLSQTSLEMKPDEFTRLTATVVPSDAGTVTWSSSNESVATVVSGFVTAVADGTAIITASVGGASATCTVTVGSTTPTPSGTTTYTVNGVSFKMVSVTGGTFKMGAQKTSSSSANYDPDAMDSEGPVHNVSLSDYYIGETEVTQALWYAVMGINPSYQLGDNLPVEKVSWDDCQVFITKLNAVTGQTFRLPTEAEWEYAARGGSKSQGYTYSGSNTIDDVAWYSGNVGDKYRPQVVATRQPNELGIYDMSGNVWEWCQDWYGDYTSSAQSNPVGPLSGEYRVLRGGWNGGAFGCRVTWRNSRSSEWVYFCQGLRLAM